jgi:chromosomal replication initiator protein
MNAKDAWRATLGQLQIELNRSTYDTWLRHADLLGYDDGRFMVTVPNAYAKDWIEQHLLSAMIDKISRVYGRACDIQIVVWNPVDEVEVETAPLLGYTEETPEALHSLNPDFTFENFVIGGSNRYASLLAQAIVDSPPGKYSPVMFYGDMGMGKTHLLQAIARGLVEKGYTAIYVPAEDFTNQLVGAIRTRDNGAFREKYRSADAVLIDDAQFLEGKESSENEIVAIWDALRNRQKTMIFASSRLPADMPRLSRDARSRLNAGPVAQLDAPDFDLRVAILQSYAAAHDLTLPLDISERIAVSEGLSVRELRGKIDQICTYTHLTGQSIRSAAEITLKTMPNMAIETRDLTGVLKATADHFHLTVDDLAGRKRTKEIAYARQIAMYLARELTTTSLPQIGVALGGRDHTTVLHGCNRIATQRLLDSGLADDLVQIQARLSPVHNKVEVRR